MWVLLCPSDSGVGSPQMSDLEKVYDFLDEGLLSWIASGKPCFPQYNEEPGCNSDVIH